MFEKITKKSFISALERVRHGGLALSLPDGTELHFQGPLEGPQADLVVHDWSVIQSLASRGDVGFADSHREGRWESRDLEKLFTFGMLNERHLAGYLSGGFFFRILEQIGYWTRLNSKSGSRRNIEAHYDLGNDFYRLWLDSSMTYSSALYRDGDESLRLAQMNKYDRLLDRVGSDSSSILEIGCGWGGFAERAIERGTGPVKGLTLSREQLAYAEQRVGKGAAFELKDYRDERGIYDTIVSIEMFEAVGIRYWKTYFDQVARCLKRGGRGLIQTIVIDDDRFDSYRRGTDMIRSYIFPGGMLPSDRQFRSAAGKSGLQVKDSFVFGEDYARTLRHWLKNFDGSREEVRRLGFDDGFIRLWRYYLASCAASFQTGRISVMQYELAHA
ncbi:MAG: class I SAM-dependent methyltransferase [Opitutales bacterium]